MVYYQEKANENMIASALTRLSRLGYTIHSILPCFSQNSTSYIVIYYNAD